MRNTAERYEIGDNYLVATFDNPIKADRAASELARLGIRKDQVSLLVTEGGKRGHFEIKDNQTKAAEGAGYGAVFGGLAAGLTAAAIPGSIFVAGPFVAALAVGALGAASGGLIGCLTGLGIAEDEAKFIKDEIERGDIAMAVQQLSDDQQEKVREVLDECGANRIH